MNVIDKKLYEFISSIASIIFLLLWVFVSLIPSFLSPIIDYGSLTYSNVFFWGLFISGFVAVFFHEEQQLPKGKKQLVSSVKIN